MKRQNKIRRPRCKHVMVIMNNRLETLPLLREVVYSQTGGDFEVGTLEVAVVRYAGTEISVPLDAVVFLPTRREIEELHAQVLRSARKMSAEEGMAFLVKAGIYTPEGQLTPEYGGPKRKRAGR